MENKLLPCPFCGGQASISEAATRCKADGTFSASYRVGCNKCKIYFSHNSEFRLVDGQPKFIFNGYELATEAWNRRANNETNKCR